MSYAQSVLQPGETIVATGRLHWTIYWPAIVSFVAGVAVLALESRYTPQHDVLIAATGLVFSVLFAVTLFRAWFARWITEIAVTDRRIIYKRGFIWRHTEEMNMDKVASVDVDQSILGRMLDYGTIHVIGTGGGQSVDGSARGIEHLHRIASPIALRNVITAK